LSDLASTLERIQERIARAAERSGRTAADVTLVAVTKTFQVDCIREALEAGITHFGENRVQEAQRKYAARGMPFADMVAREGITLHMIGSLQRNKARDAVVLFDWVQSVDRPHLAKALEKAAEAERAGMEPLPVLLQVNITGEASKSGVVATDLPGLTETVAACPHLKCEGLMTIARLGASEAELRETFASLRRLRDDLKREHPAVHHLSMGMSDDYEIAIEEGATMVRLGRALFGVRER
jgi:pyridoxal phosphate enzyme (YggS family)